MSRGLGDVYKRQALGFGSDVLPVELIPPIAHLVLTWPERFFRCQPRREVVPCSQCTSPSPPPLQHTMVNIETHNGQHENTQWSTWKHNGQHKNSTMISMETHNCQHKNTHNGQHGNTQWSTWKQTMVIMEAHNDQHGNTVVNRQWSI